MSKSGSYIYLKGTPTKAGTYSFKVNVKDSSGKTASKSLSVNIASSTTSITIGSTYKSGTVGTYYSDYILLSGGSSSYTVTYSGTLPTGLSLSKSGNYIYLKGTPTRAGTYNFKVNVKDSSGKTASKSLSVSITSAYSYNYSMISSFHTNEVRSNRPTLTKLYVLRDGEFIEAQQIEAEAGETLTFKVGDWVNENGEHVEVSNVQLKVLADENDFLGEVEISDEGIFVIPTELVNGEIIISLKASSGNKEIETDAILVNTN
ncbi:MAG: putative Ig domain-containing protein [Synergistaceae bacterium]|nr:putative Ig domain-containing protein [Synergistaceae bacterium]